MISHNAKCFDKKPRMDLRHNVAAISSHPERKVFNVLKVYLQANFPPAQLGRYRSIVRWFDYLQHIADKSSVYSPVAFQIPEANLKPPVAPPPKVTFKSMHT